MSSLPTPLRRQLESAIKQARKIAEGGARHALEALAVHEPDPYQHMDEAQRALRKKLRAQAKQLGDGESQTRRGVYEIKHLAEKLAYDQWHRLLFARYLLENNLLISPEHGVSVSLDDCEELAPSQMLKDAWAVAARFAAKELPEIFRADDPAGAVELSVNDRKPLIELVTGLAVEVFTASDSLGWCYQFWQAEKKEEVNAAGNKIGAGELPSVTQLFTEDYMVDFLLDNTLGAWHAGKRMKDEGGRMRFATEEEARQAVALPGCPWKYLRFIQFKSDGTTADPASSFNLHTSSFPQWTPSAGTFDGWPKTAQELKCLDPCMGSGHFVVAMFERLVALRMAEEKLDELDAIAAVIRDNLFGLEIDPRCTQIAAFNLALAAWRRSGHCMLPAMNLACSGLAPNAKMDDWLLLACDNDRLQRGMARLYALFNDAPVLGSLINPRASGGDLLEAEFHELQPLLEKALAQETTDDVAHEMAVTARGLAKAAEVLAGQFTLVATNVPYLGRKKHDDVLKDYCERVYPDSKTDLATCFLERSLTLCALNGSIALVTPQNWLSLGGYEELRKNLLRNGQWDFVARLGPKGFQTPMYDFNVLLIGLTNLAAADSHSFSGFDVSELKTPAEKDSAFRVQSIVQLNQKSQLVNPDSRVSTSEIASGGTALGEHVECYQGIVTGDLERFRIQFWEVNHHSNIWRPFRTTTSTTGKYDGLDSALRWEGGKGQLHEYAALTRDQLHDMHESGNRAWNKLGVAINRMAELRVSSYLGEIFDNNVAVAIPKHPAHIPALLVFCSVPEFHDLVRSLDQTLKVTNRTLIKVPFDLPYWQKVAAEKYPQGLPKPFSSDPTQWLFNGNPACRPLTPAPSPTGRGEYPYALQVAVARLLGYQWPRQTGSSFPDCPALDPDGLETLADEDGIVCLSATKGEAPASERLRGLLVQAFKVAAASSRCSSSGKSLEGSSTFDLSVLLASAGPKGSKSETLEKWLRDEFFEQHCALFHHRPFIWHIWDGHKSGFSALVNYHQLTHANLEKLTYSYLGDWIRRQQAAVDSGEAGSDARLAAARQLQTRLKLILEGEPPYDIFVRWKPLSKQAIGWHPDINDGVRMNIRPFLSADIPGGKKGAGILRTKPNIKWEKDRGKEPVRDKAEFPWFWGWDEAKQNFTGIGKEPDGNRWNDCHYSNAFKQASRTSRK